LRTALIAFLFVASTVSASQRPPQVPEWDIIPAGVVDAICTRLKMDAVATGRTTIVRVTQPLITPASVASLAGPKQKRKKATATFTNRAIPISLEGEVCDWQPIDATEIASRHDEMIVELSAPLANPFSRGEAGMFARVSLGGVHPSWYWVSLVPTGEGWVVRFVFVLST
jgi:hypothetical protein